MAELAKDLAELIQNYGPAMAEAAESVLKPLFRPGDPIPDLKDLEKNRSILSGHKFNFFPSQLEKIGGAMAGFKTDRTVWLVCAMGTGKTAMSLGATHAMLRHRPYRAIVVCPSHLVRKWRREIEWMIPSVKCKIIANFHDMIEFHELTKKTPAPMIAVIGKETAKLGLDIDRPCAAMRKTIFNERIYAKSDMQPGDTKFRPFPEPLDGWYNHRFEPQYQCNRPMNMAACPKCGTVVSTKNDAGDEVELAFDQYMKSDEPLRCKNCNDRLLTNARGIRKNPHIDRYIQRKMKGVFDMMIADEVHELAAAESIQGNMFGTIGSACKRVLALTGTLIGGKASDLHAPLWRMSPGLLRDRGFNIKPFSGGRISPIARNERAFVKRYGVMEHQIVKSRGIVDDYSGRVHRGRSGRRKSYKTSERPRPGISPNLFSHFLIARAVFMELSELGPALPTLERFLIPCKMSSELESAYEELDEDLKDAIQERIGGKGPPVLSSIRMKALDAYLDKPWNWEPIMAPEYDDSGHRIGEVVVATPRDLGENHQDDKDKKLLEIVKAELKEGRRCCIYPQYTRVRDVRPKIVKLLKDAKIRVLTLPDTVKPPAREDWIAKNIHLMDVLISHPKRVMTGLDLIQFPSLIWYQVGYSTHVLRQASARARRPTQTLPCKVFFLYYSGTIQEQALGLMGEKEAASQALEGVFDTAALRALMNGGKDDDIMSALAHSLEGKKKLNVKAVWAKVNAPIHPTPAPVIAVPTKRMAALPNQRTTQNFTVPHPECCSIPDFLFDESPVLEEQEVLFA
jgi:hypothetical protein